MIWPDATTTGYPNAPGYPGSLQDGSALTITSNTTYSFYRFPTGVLIGSNVVNVTFTGCLFLSSGGVGNMACQFTGTGNNNIVFSYCTFAPSGVTEPGPPGGVPIASSYQYAIDANQTGSLTVRNCDMWGFGNAGINANGGSQSQPHVYERNYIHDLCQDATYHSDGIGQPGGGTESWTLINNNTINSVGNTQGLAYQNTPGPSSWSHFEVTNNLIGGFGYGICVIGGTSASPVLPTSMVFTGNTFSTALNCVFGPMYTDITQGAGFVWRQNRWHVPAGAAWGNQAHDGWYWMPYADVRSGNDDTPYVSLTDYQPYPRSLLTVFP